MAGDLAGELSLTEPIRAARAAGARKWLTGVAIPDPVRKAFAELATATERDAAATAQAVRRVIDVTASTLDSPARAELERLAKELESQPLVKS
jgi:hypothetical protein